jgi:hypothetical protein
VGNNTIARFCFCLHAAHFAIFIIISQKLERTWGFPKGVNTATPQNRHSGSSTSPVPWCLGLGLYRYYRGITEGYYGPLQYNTVLHPDIMVLFGLFRVVVGDFPPFPPHVVSFWVWGHETKRFRIKIAVWPKPGQSNSCDSTRCCTSGQEWPCTLFRKSISGLDNPLGT